MARSGIALVSCGSSRKKCCRKDKLLEIAKKVVRQGNCRLNQSRAKSFFASNRHLGGSVLSGLYSLSPSLRQFVFVTDSELEGSQAVALLKSANNSRLTRYSEK